MNRMRATLSATCFVSAAVLIGCGSNGSSSSDGGRAGSSSSAGSSAAGASQAGAAGSAIGGSSNVAGNSSSGSGGAGAAGGSSTGGSAGSGGASAGAGGSAGGAGGSTGGGAGAGGSAGTSAGSITCIDGSCLNPECKPLTTAAAIDAYPGTGFDSKPSYIPNDVIIPTLDDVPDDVISPADQAHGTGGWTTKDLAWLDEHKMHWDLFINTANSCTLADSPKGCVDAIKDVLKNHYPANHTVHHYHLGVAAADGCGDANCVKSELLGVETYVNTASGGARPHLTRFRAPFGEPYQEGAGAPGYNFVLGAVAPIAVSIGWNLDSDDSNYDDGTNCTDADGKKAACPTGAGVAAKVENLVKTPGKGSYGILLMHGLFGWTHDAIQLLFDPTTGYLPKNKFRIGTVEDAVCWKYGKHTWEIVQAKSGQARAPN